MIHATEMPQMPFGRHTLSRLIAGANTLNGGSHLSRFVNMQMKRYFTEERVLDHLKACQDLGINAWQSSPGNLNWLEMLKVQGYPVHFISLGHESPEEPDMLNKLVSAGTIGIAHHGEYTDIAFKSGKMDSVREYLKRVRDTGTLVGISTHMPDVMDHVLSQDWDLDFFMCCVYERHRTREELLKLLGDVPIPIPEVYLEKDPPRMFAMIRSTEKTCLAFKILAAGRLCEGQDTVEAAFKETLTNIKPTDGIIVGMYPEYEDQAALNTTYVKRYSHLSTGQ